MKVNITQLLTIFDELLPSTNEELGIYWLKISCKDDILVTLAFSTQEDYVDIIVKNKSKLDISSISLDNCSEINVLDENRKCLEILKTNERGRCFLSLLSGPILEYKDR